MPDPEPIAGPPAANPYAHLDLDPADPEHRDMFSSHTTPLAIPAELWALWSDNPDVPGAGHWVPTCDDAPGGPTFLMSFSEAESQAAADHQANNYGVACRPVRVK